MTKRTWFLMLICLVAGGAITAPIVLYVTQGARTVNPGVPGHADMIVPAGGGTAQASDLHACPMHPDETSGVPGRCSVCGMPLESVERAAPESGQQMHPPGMDAASPSPPEPVTSARHVCPMHPDEVSDAPGTCSRCGMMLEAVHDTNSSAPGPMGEAGMPGGSPAPAKPTRAGAQAAAAATRWFCPMHPTYTSDVPGDCPICSMRLVPMRQEPPAGSPGAHPNVAEYATINIPSHRQQIIGVRTQVVGRHRVESMIRAVGRVAYDETGLSRVSTKVAGWIEALHVDRTGQFVRRGEPLLDLYSPELVATQQEYLVARDNLARLESAGGLQTARDQARALVEDAARRLSLWDISDARIRALDESGSVQRRMTLDVPVTGYVVEKSALEGSYVMPGESLIQVADLSKVWVLAQVYESQVAGLETGSPVEIELTNVGGKPYKGKIDYIYPWVDAATRTTTVRIVVPNEALVLRPEMYTTVRFDSLAGEDLLAVPNEAILDTGTRKIAFVSLEDGVFEPREVVTGARTRTLSVVLEGLMEGERVVTSGNFLIDSESRLKAAMSSMGPSPGGHRHEAQEMESGAQEQEAPPEPPRQPMERP